MNDLEKLKAYYEQYDLIGNTVYCPMTGTYQDSNSQTFINVLFANYWVCAMNQGSDYINVEKAFDTKAKHIYDALVRLEKQSIEKNGRVLLEAETLLLANFCIPYDDAVDIIKYLYANANLLELYLNNNINKDKKLVKKLN